MKKRSILYTIIVLMSASFSGASLGAQTEKTQIIETLNDYIMGTSYADVNQISNAFYPDAELFLDGKDGAIRVVPIKEYVGWFKDHEPGKFTGRVGNILSLDWFGNIATAKAEILVPQRNARYVDMFILKKNQLGQWKIISKTANSEESPKQGKRVVMIVSNAHHYGDTDIPTGNSFAEIVTAYDVFDQAGYSIDLVSPQGGAVPLAYINTADPLEKRYVYDADFMYALAHTHKSAELRSSDYEAIYYVGGGSVMFETPEDGAVQRLAMDIYEKNEGIIAAVCHGTAGIAHLKTSDGKYLVDGKTISGFPDSFERQDAAYFKTFPFLIQETIESRGGNFEFTEANESFVVVDGRLITGQNHLSGGEIAEEIVKQLAGVKE